MIEIAKVSSQGQVTIPVEIRKALRLEAGSKVAFVTNDRGEFVLANAAVAALHILQDNLEGAAEKAGFKTEDDVVAYIKEMRKNQK